MVLGRSGDEDIPTLIAKKNFTKAIELIRKQLGIRRNDPRLRLQLGDVLASAGKNAEAVGILLPLADEFAKEGFAAKAISVLKKIQRLEPGRRDIDGRLASLIQEKQRQATVSLPTPTSGGSLEIGMEEIGFEPPVARSSPAPVPVRLPEPEPQPVPEPEPEIELAPAPAATRVEPVAPPAPVRAPSPEPELSLEADPLPLDLDGGAAPAPEPEPELSLEPVEEAPVVLEPAPALEAAAEAEIVLTPEPAPAEPAPVVDQDLFTGEFEEIEPLEEAPGEVLDPMTDSRFAEELMSVIDGAFQAFPESSPAAEAAPEPEAGAQIVVSPLFKDFSVEELVAVIQGLNLLTFERGQVIIREGDPGSSLYMLTSGTVKAFVKRGGKQVPLSELEEGAFFGEVSILTGKPRTATIVAKTRCELLELDRATLDSITASHPHVWNVLQEFADQRMANKA
jgi:hypothetical protein